MTTFSVDLKIRLARRVVVLATFCLGIAAASVLVTGDRTARAKVESIVEVVRSAFVMQQGKGRWIRGTASFPDLQTLASAVMEPGICIGYRTVLDPGARGVCAGVDPQDNEVPEWFGRLYNKLFSPKRESLRTVTSFDGPQIDVWASIAPQKVIGQSWREISRLLAILGATLLGLCLLVYFSFADFLRPTRSICTGLARLADGDFATRLPAFDLAELSAVGTVFNSLAFNLEKSLAERSALTQRLIALQDEERRYLARELHDEFGQCLTAIAAVAESASHTARERLPALLPECQSIARTTAHMMEILRGALFRLRPAEIDDLGLTASLQSLVSAWNARSIGTNFAIELQGPLDMMPAAFALSLYRVAQEALTNAAKHARASMVTLKLEVASVQSSDAHPRVELTVENDGKTPDEWPPRSGLGLVGMQERITALHGTLTMEASRAGGLVLRASIPVPPGGPYFKELRGAA